jgi:hypothetical protein
VASVACAAPVARTKDTAVNIHFIQTRLLIVLLLIAFSGAECNTFSTTDERLRQRASVILQQCPTSTVKTEYRFVTVKV